MGSCSSQSYKNPFRHYKRSEKQSFSENYKKLSSNDQETYRLSQKHIQSLRNSYGSNMTGDQIVISPFIDHRKKLQHLTYPFTCIGQLKCVFSNLITYWGTGFLIHDNIVLTCAHNVCDFDTKNIAKWVQFAPGAHGNMFKSYPVTFLYIPNQYKTTNNRFEAVNHDFAILILLQSSVANQCGYFAISYQDIQPSQQKILVYGYPKDLNQRYLQQQDKQIYMFGCQGKILQVKDKRIFHNADTSSGQSGCPILRKTKNDSYYQVIGIHANGLQTRNSGLKITKSVLQKINNWVDSSNNIKFQKHKPELFPQQIILDFQKKQDPRKVKFYKIKQGKSAINIIYNQKFYNVQDSNQLIKSGNQQFQKGFLQAAKQFYQKALKRNQQDNGRDHISSQQVLHNMGLINKMQGNFNSSLEFYERSLKIKNIHYGTNNLKYIETLINIGNVYEKQGKYQQSLKKYQQSLKLLQNIDQKSSTSYALVLSNIGLIYYYQEKYDQAERYYEKSLQLKNKNDKESSLIMINILNNKGLLYLTQKRYQKAQNAFQQAFKINQLTGKQNKINAAKIINNLGLIQLNKQNYDKALKIFNNALKLKEKNFQQYHISKVETLINIGNILNIKGEYQKALQKYNQAKKIQEQNLGSNYYKIGDILTNIGNLYNNQQMYFEAISQYSKALKLYEQAKYQSYICYASTLNNKGLAYSNYEKYQQALECFDQAQKIYQKRQTQNPENIYSYVELANILMYKASVYEYQVKYQQAQICYKKALFTLKKTYGEKHMIVAQALEKIGQFYLLQKQYSTAQNYVQNALNMKRYLLQNPFPICTYHTQNIIGIIYANKGLLGSALIAYKTATLIKYYQNMNDSDDKKRKITQGIHNFYTNFESDKYKKMIYLKTLTIAQSSFGQERISLDSFSVIQNLFYSNNS